MMKRLVTLLLTVAALFLSSSTLAQAGVETKPTIYYRADFDSQSLPKQQGHLGAFAYTDKGKIRPPGRFQKENTYGQSPWAYTFAETSTKEVMLGLTVSVKGKVPYLAASRNTWVAFCLYAKKGTGSYRVSVWNHTKKANKQFSFKTAPASWQVVRVNLFGPGLLDEGDLFRGISIHNRGNGPRSWIVDNLVVWQGTDRTPPTAVTNVKVAREGGRTVLTWPAATDNIFVVKYKIYRGTVAGFAPTEKALLGESTSPGYVDTQLLRDSGYFYMVRAVDCNGNLSPVSPGLKVNSSVNAGTDAGAAPPKITGKDDKVILFQDSFKNMDHWDCDYQRGDKAFGKKRLQAKIEDGCFVLGTSAAGATLKNKLPKNYVIETKLKVSTVKTNPKQPNPRIPGASIFVRKTEKDGMWNSYIIRFWFSEQAGKGQILFGKYSFDLVKGKSIKQKRYLLEKRWTLRQDTWYDVRVAVVDNQITAWVDGQKIGTITDKDNRHPDGAIAISGYSWPSYAFYKDFRVLE